MKNKFFISIGTILIVQILLTPLSLAKTRLAFVDFPPYEYLENDTSKGILVDTVKEIFLQINEPLELELLPFKRAFIKAKTGKIDGLFNFYKVPEREAFFDYSVPLIDNELVFFVPQDSTVEYKEINDLNELRVGVMFGYSYGQKFDQHKKFYRMSSYTHELNFQKLID
ncbi:MAG: amino acid ABC transporter substrate-binding protein, partial [Desulfobacteraceae bacterium]|nr:amino acid ABC transporter substrate-binding protein [Desulfobacteraceae bacterium]